MATRDAYRAQVNAGMPMGDGWYLARIPGLVRAARQLRRAAVAGQGAVRGRRGCAATASALDLAQRQAQWVVGRNPFAQSTMYGEGYDWAQQYSVSSGDFVGSLPVGMQSRGDERPAVLAVAEHVRLQGSVGALDEPLALAHRRPNPSAPLSQRTSGRSPENSRSRIDGNRAPVTSVFVSSRPDVNDW